MKIICSPINLTVDLCYDKLNIIVIENIYGFRSFVNEMNLASLSEAFADLTAESPGADAPH